MTREKGMNRAPIFAIVILVGLAATPQNQQPAGDSGPAAGIHTIRVDDALLQLAADGGFSLVIRLV